MSYLFLRYWSVSSYRLNPLNYRLLVILRKLTVKTLLLKTPHTWHTEHRKIYWQWPGSCVPTYHLQPVSRASKGFMCARGGEKTSPVLPSWTDERSTTGLTKHAYRYEGGMNIMGVVNQFLIAYKACSTIWTLYLILITGTKTCGFWVKVSRRWPNITILLNEHSNKLSLASLASRSLICETPHTRQRRCFCRRWELLQRPPTSWCADALLLAWNIYTTLPPQCRGDNEEGCVQKHCESHREDMYKMKPTKNPRWMRERFMKSHL